MMSWTRWVIWLPVAVTFGIVVTVVGFGFDSFDAKPATLLFLLIMVLLGTVFGLIVGLVAVISVRFADRLVAGPLSPCGTVAKIAVHALVAAIAVAVAVWIYTAVTPAGTNEPSAILPIALVSVVASASAVISAWGRFARKDSHAD